MNYKALKCFELLSRRREQPPRSSKLSARSIGSTPGTEHSTSNLDSKLKKISINLYLHSVTLLSNTTPTSALTSTLTTTPYL